MSTYLPELSLQAHCRGVLGDLTAVPLVIQDGSASRPLVHAASAAARRAGIAPGMPVAAAQARAADLAVVPRDAARERALLTDCANCLAQFTPMVSVEPAGVSLELSTTLRLFGGLTALAARLRAALTALGLSATLGIAPTPRAAYVLARASHHMTGVRMCREEALLPERLAGIPLALFGWRHDLVETLAGLGLTRVKDVLAQPRAGLRRRFDGEVLDDLDRALGRLPDPREPYRLPETFNAHLELLFEVHEAQRLMIPVGRLLAQLEGFLIARGRAAAGIVLTLRHNRRQVTTHAFGARRPERRALAWQALIRERLAAHPLPEAVLAVSLSADPLEPWQEENTSWLPTPDAHREKWHGLLARVGSRLGRERVFRLRAVSDHRPELAWQAAGDDPAARHDAGPTASPRPLMLLTEPRALLTVEGAPQHHGPLSLLAGPERIEAGWWDGKPVARDYFVARNPQHEVCWIFRDYREGRRWYLHGYFS